MLQAISQNKVKSYHIPSFEERKNLILSCLDENKAEDIISIDVQNKSDFADYMIIATGLSRPHITSLVSKIIHKAKTELHLAAEIEGTNQYKWVFIGLENIVLHIFDKDTRNYYQIEKMWLL